MWYVVSAWIRHNNLRLRNEIPAVDTGKAYRRKNGLLRNDNDEHWGEENQRESFGEGLFCHGNKQTATTTMNFNVATYHGRIAHYSGVRRLTRDGRVDDLEASRYFHFRTPPSMRAPDRSSGLAVYLNKRMNPCSPCTSNRGEKLAASRRDDGKERKQR